MMRRRAGRLGVVLAVVIGALVGLTTRHPAPAAATGENAAVDTAALDATTLLVLGDSLTWGANYFGKANTRLSDAALFTNVVYDARGSRRIGGITSTTFSGANTYKALRAKGLQPTAVIVALGTNDIYFTQRKRNYVSLIREMMNELTDVPVVWLNIHRVESPTMTTRSRVFNNTLNQVLAEYPLASVYDWASTARATRSVMAFDKIHLSPSGYVARTEAMLEAARRLAMIVTERATPTTTTVPTNVPTTVPVETDGGGTTTNTATVP